MEAQQTTTTITTTMAGPQPTTTTTITTIRDEKEGKEKGGKQGRLHHVSDPLTTLRPTAPIIVAFRQIES
ncbi:hypothetical protein COCOBI_06-6120 [Coccomyxa sp. Obi]|nr:hypothetical protein COCOBI_06-6120 [Coccomyxa sp. Obi]